FSFASLLMNPRTPLSTLFPYTTLFRSIFPERDMGQRLAHNLVSPNILDYIELADDYSIAEIKATEKMFGKNLRELNIRAKYGCNVMAIKNEQGMNISPYAEDQVQRGDILVIVGKNADLQQFEVAYS